MSRRKPSRRRGTAGRAEVQELVDETIALHHWLAWVADQLYDDDGRGAPRRWVLRRLKRHGPQTVPALARAKALRRQSVQPVVDALLADGLVARAPNPRHARSHLVRLTERGAAAVARMDRIDASTLASVARGLPAGQLAAAAGTLRAVRAGFEIESRWRR